MLCIANLERTSYENVMTINDDEVENKYVNMEMILNGSALKDD